MDLQTIVNLVRQTPQVQQAVDAIQRQLARTPIMPEDIDEIISMLEAVVEDPNRYPEVRAAAIKDGVISEQEAPQEYSPEFVLAVLVALYEYRDRLSQEGYARGGLKVAARKLQAAGRGGDSMLAHINPREAEMLQRMGGSGTVNPNTGLREYKGGGGILGAVIPIALNFIAPGLGTAIGTAMGASGVAAGMLGSAVIGGLSAAVTGGDPLKGAVLGGLGGGLGGTVGGAASDALGLGLGQTAQGVLGGALVGGATGALTGQGFGKGALMGAVGSGLGAATQGLGEGAVGAGIGSAGQMAGRMLTAGYNPKQALLGGALSGLATGLTFGGPGAPKPSQMAVDEMREMPGGMNKMLSEFKPGETAINPETGDIYTPAGQQGPTTKPTFLQQMFGTQPTAQTSGTGLQEPPAASTSPLSLKALGTTALLGSLMTPRPPEVSEAVAAMSPAQQEYFNRPSIQWDWNKLQNDANAANMSLSQYMSTYWPQVTSGAYNKPTAPTAMAMGGMYAMGGGPLGAVARLARGSGSGRDDTINARLSDGEYVMDAETVAMLGDGSTDEGARRLDAMRAQLRKHKGKTLARGKFSPNAKSPLAYLKGAA